MKTWNIRRKDTTESIFNALTEMRLIQRKAELAMYEAMNRVKEAEHKKALFFELAEKHIGTFGSDISLRITSEDNDVIGLTEIDVANEAKQKESGIVDLLKKLGR